MLARAPLPKGVNAVGDRIGLNYRIDRKTATQNYVENMKKDSRLEMTQLKNTFYSLTESRTLKDDASKQQNTRRQNVKNPLKLSSKVRKTLYKLTDAEKQELKYSTFEKVHELWQQYTRKVNDLVGVFRMDLHGCKLTCTASKNPTLVGTEGIVVQETKNTFLIIKQTNRLLSLPKRESIFEFKVGENVYRIHGCNLLFTTQTRSKIKYKQQKYVSDI